MLPGYGYFKNIQCPYNKANLCHRPNCNYRHGSAAVEEKKITVSSSYLYENKSTSAVEQTEPQYPSVDFDNYDNSAYVPTPFTRYSKPPGILKAGNSFTDKSASSVPEYKPTPISKLKELHIPSGQYGPTVADGGGYSPEYVGPIRKKKNIEEYDPTEIKCVSKKSVSFADETGIGLVACEPGFSSEDDFDDSASAPKFSDDDSDENEETRQVPQQTINRTSTKNCDVEKEPEPIESDPEDKKIDEFSLVDKILTETKRNEKLLKFRKNDVVVVKPPPPPSKPSLILKGAKVETSVPSKSKSSSNNDIYNTEDSSQSSIPDYFAFDALVPPVEIDSFIKSKYDKKTFDSDIPTYKSPLQKEEKSTATVVEASSNEKKSSKYSEKEFKLTKKDSDDKNKSSKTDGKTKHKKKVSNKEETLKSETKLSKNNVDKKVKGVKSIGNNKKDVVKNKESKKLQEKSSNLKEKNSGSSKKTEENNKISDKIKKSSNKLGESIKIVSKTHKDKSKDSESRTDQKTKHKSNEKSSKHKSHPHELLNKDKSKNTVSSSSDELQDGKVSSSSFEKKGLPNQEPKHSKSIEGSAKSKSFIVY